MNKYIFLITTAIFTLALPCLAETDGAIDTVEGRIMEMNLSQNLLVVNEININLDSNQQDGKKYWQTTVIDQEGNSLKIESLGMGDWIKTTGTLKEQYEFDAAAILLINKAQEEENEASGSTQEATEPATSGSDVRLEDGVWVN